MSKMTVGLSAPVERSKLSLGGRPCVETPVANDITIGADGEKPSAVFQPAGFAGIVSEFVGKVPSGIAMRLPVLVVASSTSNTDDGHGVMQ